MFSWEGFAIPSTYLSMTVVPKYQRSASVSLPSTLILSRCHPLVPPKAGRHDDLAREHGHRRGRLQPAHTFLDERAALVERERGKRGGRRLPVLRHLHRGLIQAVGTSGNGHRIDGFLISARDAGHQDGKRKNCASAHIRHLGLLHVHSCYCLH